MANHHDGVYFTIGDICDALGARWSARRVRRWLGRAGILERRFGVVITTPERLLEAFPELYRALIGREISADLDDDDLDDI